MSILNKLYNTKIGRIILRPLISRPVSDLSGVLMDMKASKLLIAPFAKMNGIRLDDYVFDDINCFNDFFCRRIKHGLRPISTDPADFIAPCDGLLTVHRITKGKVMKAKQTTFNIHTLLRDKKLAKSFEGGYCLVFRLCVNHYHRYIWFDSGKAHKNRRIEGFYHTVQPVALEGFPVFTENCREYAVIDSKSFGRCVQMEVGAMLVGRIVNPDKSPRVVYRGDEKGRFEYGGSTIILLVPEGKLKLRDDILNARSELPVKMGEVLGQKG